MTSIHNDQGFISDIIDGMYDWVRVIDREDNMIYVNKSMSEAIETVLVGKKCYSTLGRITPCENCVSRKAVFDGQPHEKEEIIGEKIFSVMSSPVKNVSGEIIAVVEVLRDVTETKILHKIVLDQNNKLQSDLNMAKKLQCNLLPKGLLEEKIDFSFIYQPCETLGGDFLDIFKIDEDHIGLYIADVSGHGVSASMLTIFLRASFNKKSLSPADVLTDLFSAFNASSFNQDLYITVFYAIIDLKNQVLIYSNAGHNVCPLIFNKDKFEILRVPGIPISNWLETPDYLNKHSQLATGDRLFFYTDGVVELRNSQNEQFGQKRLLENLLGNNADLNTVLIKIVDNACLFAGLKDSTGILDDITMALLEIK